MQFSPDSGITSTSFPAEAIAGSHQKFMENSSQTKVNIKVRAKTHSILSISLPSTGYSYIDTETAEREISARNGVETIMFCP